MPDLTILGLEIEKAIVIFRINYYQIFLKHFVRKKKSFNLRPKMPYLSDFGLKFEKAVAIIEISVLKFV